MNHTYPLLAAILLFFSQLNAQTIGILQNDSLSFNGYTLFAPSTNEYTYLIDNCGNQINSWVSDYRPGMSAYLLETGELLRTAHIPSSFNGGGTGGKIEIYSWEGIRRWNYQYSTDTVHQHHDVQFLPNGNVLIIAWEWHSAEEAQAMGRNPEFINNQGIWSEQVVEVKPMGLNDAEIVWEWHLWDHLIQDFDSTLQNFGVISEHPELLDINFFGGGNAQTDWIHFNSIDYNPELDQILLSSRHLSEFYIIDHSTTSEEAASHEGGNAGKGGDFLYRWGNPISYKRGTTEDQNTFGQHDVTWIPSGLPNAGKILYFNNGIGRPDGNYSSVDMISPPMDESGHYIIEEDAPYGPDTLDWIYVAPNPSDFFSNRVSGAQQMPNGNVLICSGRRGIFFEVTPDGERVWDYINPVMSSGPGTQGTNVVGNDVFKIRRYAPDFQGFYDKDLTVGVAIELNPVNQHCPIFMDTVSTSISETVLENIRVINNPIGDELLIENLEQQTVEVEVFNLSGQQMLSALGQSSLLAYSIGDWPKGMYVVRVLDRARKRYWIEKIVK